MGITLINYTQTHTLTQVRAGIWSCLDLFSFNISSVYTKADHLETYWKQTKQGGHTFTKNCLPLNKEETLQPVKINIYHHFSPTTCYRGHDRRFYKTMM